MDSHVLLISQIFISYSTNAYLLLSSQSGHSHLPAGAAVRPRHSKWNHSIGQATLSHAIISPYSPSWHQQYTSFLSLDFAALFDFALEVRIPLEHRLFAWAFLTPSARHSLMLSRCCNQTKHHAQEEVSALPILLSPGLKWCFTLLGLLKCFLDDCWRRCEHAVFHAKLTNVFNTLLEW